MKASYHEIYEVIYICIYIWMFIFLKYLYILKKIHLVVLYIYCKYTTLKQKKEIRIIFIMKVRFWIDK